MLYMSKKFNSSGHPWIYQLQEDYTVYSKHLEGVEYENQWILITGGSITIRRHYAWDGCTPKYFLPVFGWVGVSDGPINDAGYPQAYHASLVHDALCQFRNNILINKESTLNIFKEMLVTDGFSQLRATIYTKAVDWFGPQDWLGNYVATDSGQV